MTKNDLRQKGYKLYGNQYSCREHGEITEKWYLPNGSGEGVIDYQIYCPKHKRTLFDNIEVIYKPITKHT